MKRLTIMLMLFSKPDTEFVTFRKIPEKKTVKLLWVFPLSLIIKKFNAVLSWQKKKNLSTIFPSWEFEYLSSSVFLFYILFPFKVARNEVKNASFAQRSAHRDSRIWRPELIEPAAERKRRARRRRPTVKSTYPDPQILPQCNISSNYRLQCLVFLSQQTKVYHFCEKNGNIFGQILRYSRKCVKTWIIENVNWSQKRLGILPSSLWKVFLRFFLQMNPIPMRKKNCY